MVIKKINSILAIITGLLLAGHISVMTYSLFTGWYNHIICAAIAHSLCTVFFVHVITSLSIFLFCHDGTAISCKEENTETIIQRASALIMLVFIHTHTSAYPFIAQGKTLTDFQTLGICVTEVIFVVFVTLHTIISLPKALVTLGILRSDKALKAVKIVCETIYGIFGLAAVTGVIRFFAVM